MKVFVTPRAERSFESIVGYIKENWGESTAKQFVVKADEIFKLLQNYPNMGQKESGDIRGFQLTGHTRLLYTVRDKKVIILAFFDVRQNPSKKFN